MNDTPTAAMILAQAPAPVEVHHWMRRVLELIYSTGIALGALPSGTNTIGATKDAGPAWTVARLYTPITTATTTDITAAPTSGQKIVLDDCLISCDAACAVSIVEQDSGTVFATVFVPASGTVQITLRDALKAAVADKKLRAITSAEVNCSITACYHSEA